MADFLDIEELLSSAKVFATASDKIPAFGKYSELLEASIAFSKAAKAKSGKDCVFPADHPKVKDNKDHYPLGDEKQARNALARASQHKSVPSWYDGTLKALVSAVAKKVHAKYPSIEISDAGKKPGKD